MMALPPDKTTKVILAAIALGPWANAIPRFVHPAAAQINPNLLLTTI